MATDKTAVEIRRENLLQLIKDKFENNRSEFARAADVQPNQVSLMLNGGSAHARPISETRARNIEANLGLPTGYLDRTQQATPKGLAFVEAMKVPPSLQAVFAVSSEVGGVYVTDSWVSRHHVMDPTKLHVVEVACDGMDPEVKPGDQIIVEWLDATQPADKLFTRDGTYVILTRSGPMLRRLHRGMSGYVSSSPNRMYSHEERKDLSKIQLQARMVCKLSLG